MRTSQKAPHALSHTRRDRGMKPLIFGRRVGGRPDHDMLALIEEAVAAGKVTVYPADVATGPVTEMWSHAAIMG